MTRAILRRLLLATALGLVGLAVASSAPARPPGHGGPDRRLSRLIEGIDLDDATRGAVEEVLAEAQEQRKALRPRLRAAHDRMRGLMEAEEPDEAAILEQLDAVSTLELQSQKDRIRTLLRVRALLPADARAELVERMQRHGGRPGREGPGPDGHRGPRRHGPPPGGPPPGS